MLIYLASYPRSGNAWSQALLKHYFNLSIYSVYSAHARERLLTQFGNDSLMPGDIESAAFLTPTLRQRIAASDEIFVVKTHELPFTAFLANEKVLHIVRHPGAALWSYLHYLRDVDGVPADLDGVIKGDYGFGSWSVHMQQWLKAGCALKLNYLRYSYEQLHENAGAVCAQFAAFFDRPLLQPVGSLPDFEHFHKLRPNLARRGRPDEWETHFTPAQRLLLEQVHGATMQELGYDTTLPSAAIEPLPAVTDNRPRLAQPDRHDLATFVKQSWLGAAWYKAKPVAHKLRWQANVMTAKALHWRTHQNDPVVLHITHHKAGSQWVAEILKHAVSSDRVVLPLTRAAHFTPDNLRSGAVFLTLYLPRNRVEAVTASFTGPIRRFVVIRDLRDTLVSLYFSVRYSHPVSTLNSRVRTVISSLEQEAGMRALLCTPFDVATDASLQKADVEMMAAQPAKVSPMENIARMQRSWISAPDRLLVRYEDLVADEHHTFQRIMDYCQIRIAPERLHYLVADNTFTAMTGRQPGQEDIMAHARKGIVGDWRNYFTETMKAEFKSRYGKDLIATGYEKDLNW